MTEEKTLPDDLPSKDWHLDKRVPIALIFAILIQTFSFGFWAATIQANQDAMRNQINLLGDYQGRMTRVETQVVEANKTLERIDSRLQRMEERRR